MLQKKISSVKYMYLKANVEERDWRQQSTNIFGREKEDIRSRGGRWTFSVSLVNMWCSQNGVTWSQTWENPWHKGRNQSLESPCLNTTVTKCVKDWDILQSVLMCIQNGELAGTHTIAKLQEAVQHTVCKHTTAEKSYHMVMWLTCLSTWIYNSDEMCSEGLRCP